mmetsp:Transcript_13950/g.22200  ORF Transcript_13950/g.22200 Transcript_13950/m.22200 type:complete len:230 (-) Transcript_13950:366-1055(-)|eukprot:CAMPEP_0115090878 /NCGR_PEP_ID=MMETSP0227-20121206/25726_1 /TAXON_ID=89957 /ORGANISM="Polarella glacialis, Strain CCMP 1383" /LENGTH=229 /DNA_ID=CAMNT_0002482177 /DNA_START=79 /DNA_END=768 /DNA_ORIENTATION=-
MMRVLALNLVLAASVVAAETEQASVKPILTTDLFHGTAELIYDIYDAAYSKFLAHHVATHSVTVLKAMEPVTQALPKDPIAEICLKVGCQKEEVLKKLGSAMDMASNAKNTIVLKAGELHEPMTQVTHTLVGHFENFMPAYRGLIPRTPGNLVLFCLYITAVLFVLLKVSLMVLRLQLSIFMFFCCCGCFRRRAASPAGGKAVKAATTGKAATNGKAATTGTSDPKKKK